MDKDKLARALRAISDENDRERGPAYDEVDELRWKARFPGNVPDDELSAALVAAIGWARYARGCRATSMLLVVMYGGARYAHYRKEHREARQVVRVLREELASRVEGRAATLRRMRAALRAAS